MRANTILLIGAIVGVIATVLWYFEKIEEPTAAMVSAVVTALAYYFAKSDDPAQNMIKQKNKNGNNYGGDHIEYKGDVFRTINNYRQKLWPIVLLILFSIFLWQFNNIKLFLGYDKFFSKNDESFKILILHFAEECLLGSKNYDAGYVLDTRLKEIGKEENLKMITKYWKNFDTKELVSDADAEKLRNYHNADMILFGRYQTSDCSSEGDKICLNFITDEKWGLNIAGKDLSNKEVYGGFDDLKKGLIQEKIENIAFFISILAQINSIDHERYFSRLSSLLDKSDVETPLKAIILNKLAFQLMAEGKVEKALEFFEKALKLSYSGARVNHIASTYEGIGKSYLAIGEKDKALKTFKELNRFNSKIVNDPLHSKFKLNNLENLAFSNRLLGMNYRALRDSTKALFHFTKSCELYEQLLNSDSTSFVNKRNLAISFEKLGEESYFKKNIHQALKYFSKQLHILKEIVKSNPSENRLKFDLQIAFEKMGDCYKEIGQEDNSLFYYKQEEQILSNLIKNDAINVDYKNGLGFVNFKIGLLFLEDLNDIDKALLYFNKSKSIRNDLIKQSPETVEFQNNLSESARFIKVAKEMKFNPLKRPKIITETFY